MSVAIPVDFVPSGFDAGEWEDIEPYLDDLRDRPVGSAEEFEKWLIDRSELMAACEDARANRFIAMTCDTANEAKRAANLAWLDSVSPKLKVRQFALDRRQLELAAQFPLPSDRYGVLMRDTEADVGVFRDENVPLETSLDALEQEFSRISGAMTASFRGEEMTFPQLAVFQESTDRSEREETWRLMADRRLRDADELDTLYDRMVSLRDRIARNAGFVNFTGYSFRRMRRFDYTPDDCLRFHDACERIVVPFVRRLDARRRDRLGIATLRPWDLKADDRGRDPLRPFQGGVDLVRKSRAAFGSLDPRLADLFARLGDGSTACGAENGAMLDLDSRKGKAPGGYQWVRYRAREPFIFMNAAGVHQDVAILVHEAGHAFHSMACERDPLQHYRDCPIEFCEVASMSMELLAMRHYGVPGSFYPDPRDLNRACATQIGMFLKLLPWIATIDAFQHWIYGNPGHSRDERTAAWLDIRQRFDHDLDWSALEPYRARQWHAQQHLFTSPFYYIEYGIALLGAMQLWLHSLEAGDLSAVDRYLAALTLGGSRPLPELFATAGLAFDFGPETMQRVVARAEAELAKYES